MGKMIEKEKKAKSQTGLRIRKGAGSLVREASADDPIYTRGFAIGVAKPLSINVSTYGTGVIPENKIEKILTDGKIFDFRPAMMIKDLELTAPKGWSYRKICNYGHFGSKGFPWEKTDRVDALREAAGLR
jgi:S-adenosylmethionine synthetase